MSESGAIWGVSWGLEVPLVFAPKGFAETPTLKRSNAFPVVAEECKAVREGVGLVDISGFSRYEVTGPNAEAWLQRMMATTLPKAGRARLAVMLAPSGRLKGDLTLMNWGDGTWWIMGSYYLREWHMRWFHDHLDDGVFVRDISDAVVGFGLSGPKSREVLQALTHQDISHGTMPFLACQELDIGLIRARVGRLSVCGELGYEINCSAAEHITLRKLLLEAGKAYDLHEFGFYAMNSLRMEKSFGVWNAEFMQAYTPGMTRMDRWINFGKGDFVGREAAQKEKEQNTAPQRLVTLEVDALDADASGYEPVWKQGKRVGYITSGSFGHHIGKSLAMALVDVEHAEDNSGLTAHIVGVERGVRIIPNSPYDPKGEKIRL